MDDKEYFDLKFDNLEKTHKEDNNRICETLEKINIKISKLFEKTDNHHDQLVLQERDISDLKEKNKKKEDRGWTFFLNVASKIAVAIILIILSYLQFKGG